MRPATVGTLDRATRTGARLSRRDRVQLAADGQASPTLYGEMMAEDRRIRLAGYEVYRFGDAELKDPDMAGPMLRQFFLDLLAKARHRHEGR